MINKIFMKAIAYDEGDAKRIQHFTKVYSYARLIGIQEKLDENSLMILEISAILHDIGIHESERIYNDSNGKHQEELGPAVALKLLDDINLTEEEINRICFLIAHHHTYNNINDLDYQILVEADFIVNMFEDGADKKTLVNVYKKIFKTETGKKIFRDMYKL